MKRKAYAIILLLAVIFIVLFVLPIGESIWPEIATTTPDELYQGTVFLQDMIIILDGSNLENCEEILVNGDPIDFTIYENTNQRISFSTNTPLQEMGDDFEISVKVKFGNWLSLTSNKVSVELIADESYTNIVDVEPAEISALKKEEDIFVTLDNPIEDMDLIVNGNKMEDVIISEDFKTIYFHADTAMLADDTMEICMGKIEEGEWKLCQSNVWNIPIVKPNFSQYTHDYSWVQPGTLIMHALGGTEEGLAYTNSVEAFEHSSNQNCKVMEMDITFSSDNVLVGRHDWVNDALYTYSTIRPDELTGLPKKCDELQNLYENMTIMTWENMVHLMAEDEDIYVITDTKYDNEAANSAIFNEIVRICNDVDPRVLDRVIVQIYSQAMYEEIMDIYPFKSVIYTLYASSDTEEQVLEFVRNSNVRAITLPAGSIRDNDDFLNNLQELDCFVFVHTINDVDSYKKYLLQGYSGIYTDFIWQRIDPQDLTIDDLVVEEAEPETENEDDLIEQYNLINNYLEELKNDDYIILLAVNDEAAYLADETIEENLEAIGVLEDYGFYVLGKSFLGIYQGGDAVYEQIGTEEITYQTIYNNLAISISSYSGLGGSAEIRINDKTLSSEERGLLVAVYSQKLGEIIECSQIDLFGGYKVTRINY